MLALVENVPTLNAPVAGSNFTSCATIGAAGEVELHRAVRRLLTHIAGTVPVWKVCTSPSVMLVQRAGPTPVAVPRLVVVRDVEA